MTCPVQVAHYLKDLQSCILIPQVLKPGADGMEGTSEDILISGNLGQVQLLSLKSRSLKLGNNQGKRE